MSDHSTLNNLPPCNDLSPTNNTSQPISNFEKQVFSGIYESVMNNEQEYMERGDAAFVDLTKRTKELLDRDELFAPQLNEFYAAVQKQSASELREASVETDVNETLEDSSAVIHIVRPVG